ncbi:GbsR/MarR family transcriptional regulator [Halopseudomonas pelagia]|uniref:MarR family transcriptional regulator n=1 Tax=Halopseudomonas pelagia TaxID=553151 RepID=A0AA91U2E0_9GAMM|nr:MarR family transcriptional regulator [Halopseudomonas pelagia]PCC99459.1 MarR family transcriptional regulator [Halopseudomonas pelagia]QFY56461.1 MarR family transcriptional regulator [Halopseudomonas pelagia]
MTSLTEPESRLIERLGQQAQSDGLPRIAGQIWAALIISDGQVSSSDLMELLHVSKGSVSTNTRLLEMLGILERGSKPGERQDFFSIRSKPYAAFVEEQLKRVEAGKAIVAEAKSTITKSHAQAHLNELENFYTLYNDSSKELLKRLKSQSAEDGA